MFSTEQLNEFQNRLHHTFQSAQQRASVRARELELDARKMFETLGDRAQAELEELLSRAQVSTKEQVSQLGAELVKLGKRLQDLASRAAKAQTPASADAAASGVQPPAELQ